MLAVLVAMLVSGRLPLHATLWQFCVFWLPWMALNLVASALLCRGQASLWDGAYSNLLTTEIFTRAAFVLVHPFRTSFKVTPKDGIDDGGWSAARQLRLVLIMAGILAAAVVARVLALAGVLALPHLGGLAVVAGLSFALWELVVVGAALWRVTRRHQVRRHYRVPVEVAGVVGGTLVRVVDLTPGGAGMIGPHPLEVGAEVDLRLDLPSVTGEIRVVRVVFTVCSSRPAKGARVADGRHARPVDRRRRGSAHRALPRGQLPLPVDRCRPVGARWAGGIDVGGAEPARPAAGRHSGTQASAGGLIRGGRWPRRRSAIPTGAGRRVTPPVGASRGGGRG